MANKPKKILLQCQGLIYYYLGLAAIYTKYPDRNVDVDVLFSSSKIDLDFEAFTGKIRKSKYVKNVYVPAFNKPRIYDHLLLKRKTFFNYLKYYFRYKRKLIKEISEQIKLTNKYSEIFFSHEQGHYIITSLKFIQPQAKFVMYGDGPGLIFNNDTKLMDPNNEPIDFRYFKEIRPNEVIGLLPYTMDNSMNLKGVPIKATDKEIFLDLIRNDSVAQKEVNEFSDDIINKYPDKNKTLLLLSTLDSLISQEEQINLYMEIVDKYCSPDSVLILKSHPAGNDIVYDIEQRCKGKNIATVVIPENLKVFPIELYHNLLKNIDNIITFISSSKLSINYLYNIDCIDAWEIIQNHPVLADAMEKYIMFFRTINEKTKTWDKKSLIYKYSSK